MSAIIRPQHWPRSGDLDDVTWAAASADYDEAHIGVGQNLKTVIAFRNGSGASRNAQIWVPGTLSAETPYPDPYRMRGGAVGDIADGDLVPPNHGEVKANASGGWMNLSIDAGTDLVWVPNNYFRIRDVALDDQDRGGGVVSIHVNVVADCSLAVLALPIEARFFHHPNYQDFLYPPT